MQCDSLETSISSAGQLSTSHQSLSSTDVISSRLSSNEMYSSCAKMNTGDSLGVTVKLRSLNTDAAAEHGQGYGATSIQSFEAYFEDEDEDDDDNEGHEVHKTEKLSQSWIQPAVSGTTLDNLLTGSSESSRSSISDADERDSEADDNMSAITWPDLISRKVLIIHPTEGQTHAVRDQPVHTRISEDDTDSEALIKEDVSVGDYVDSVEGDSFLRELDALSLSWLKRKKVLEDKEKRKA